MMQKDEDIILGLQQEFDPSQFAILVNRHHSMIKNKCLKYVKHNETAEDLCQDIWIRVYLKLNTFRNGSRFTTWLIAIINNHCADYLKRNRKGLHQEITDKLSKDVGEMLENEDCPSKDLSEDLLNTLLEQITPEGKLILLLKYKEQKSIREIQTALNINESTVKMRLKRAKDKINQLYENS